MDYAQFAEANYDCIISNDEANRFLVWTEAKTDKPYLIVTTNNRGTIVSEHATVDEARIAFSQL